MILLTPAQRRDFKAKAHHLEPVVIVGDAGLTPAVMYEIDVHLNSHELIKIRVTGEDRDARVGMKDLISQTLDASPVQHIGKILVMYRPKPVPAEGEKTQATHKPRTRNKKRRTKRSYHGS